MVMTKTASVNVRIQENIKKQAEQILETIGIPRATAIDMFYRQIIMNKGIPFSVTIPNEVITVDTLSEEELDNILTNGLSQAKEGKSKSMNLVFSKLESEI
ncbi:MULTISPECIES: type II toxin-antitoxin system RelB/DinJ family antitoxin [unclassified Gemella]|uniref:type II toxin-antitoxin system RelB/DinJ family antitoxin n=1 Tax=unclassified Gemella TaxID=2624949 RepID=UPI001C0527A4|nr:MULTISPECIES: type II toxin-antitoxin system RelB/DinJ family antitoxin [unclassified Gemella]MBU0279380.1 type II toxin-antitoxin system RelB/DinJ family antitoxin [Gemella sp. zg-1178]QWQ39146.1 type II toxin-antitoxin system RelB/DinJ family antitoxin [Gemella sp. zg-570]